MARKKEKKTSVEKALDLIEVLKAKDDLGVTELSNELGLNKNNVFRLLATLEVKGIVEQDEDTGHYKLGKKVLYLEYAYLKNLPYLKDFRPYLREIRNLTKETVYLSKYHDNNIIYIYAVESKAAVHVHSRLARRYKASEIAPGRAFKKAKKQKGFIFEYDIETVESEVSEGATIIRDEYGNPLVALSVVAPINRMDEKRIKTEIKDILKEYSQKLEKLLTPSLK